MYPMLCDGVTIDKRKSDSVSEMSYYVVNKNGDEFDLPYEQFREVAHADGTHPLNIPVSLLKELKKSKILTTNRFVYNGICSRFIVFPIGKNALKYRTACRWINAILPLLAPILLLIAIRVQTEHTQSYIGGFNFAVEYLLIFLTLAVHEAAHFVAGIAYQYDIMEVGVLFAYVIPYGAYVGYSPSNSVSRLKRLQFSISGVEANLLFAAILLFFSVKASPFDLMFSAAADINLLICLFNLLPATGRDGEVVLSAILGVDSVSENAKRFITSHDYRKHTLQAGCVGYIRAICYLLSLASSVIVGAVIFWDILYILNTVFR